MIQFSSLPGIAPANPAKAALPGAAEGAFAGMLEGEIGQETAMDGKSLPVAGKELPLPGKLALSLPAKLLGREEETSTPEPLPTEDHGTMPTRDSDEGPAEAVVAPAKFFLDPIIPFAAPPPAPALSEAAAEGADTASSGRAAPQPMPAAKPDHAATGSKPQAQPGEAARPLPVLPTIELPQAIAEQPADPRMAKLVSMARPAASREFRIELGAEAKPVPAMKLSEALAADKPGAALAQAITAAPSATDAPATAQISPAARLADANGTARPHDFAALVDRLVEARNAMTPHEATMTVKHADFGDVSLRFSHQDGALSVAMSSRDPDFDRAVNAALPSERAQSDTSGQPGTQGNRRDDAASRGTAGADASAQDGNARRGSEAADDEIDQNNPGRAARKSAGSRGGIFA